MKGAVAIKFWDLFFRLGVADRDGGIRPAIKYGFALICLAIALAVRLALNPILGHDMPYALFVAAAMLAAWIGRVTTGFVTLSVGMFVGYQFFVPVQSPPGQLKAAEVAIFLSAIIPGAVSIWIIELLHRSKEKSDEISANLRIYAHQLEYEIQERQQVEKEIRCSQRVTQAISEASDVAEAFTVAFRELCQCTGWSLGQTWLFSEDGTKLVCGPSSYCATRQLEPFHRLSQQMTFACGVGMVGKAWKEKRIQWLPELRDEQGFTRKEMALELGIQSAAAFPVIADENVMAIIEFFVIEKTDGSDRLVRLAASVTSQLAVLMQRKQAELALRESERRYEALARVSPVGIFRTDSSGNCVYVNHRWCEITGIDPQKATGDAWQCALHPEDRGRVAEKWKEACASGGSFAEEYRCCRNDGSMVWVFAQSAADRNELGEIIGYVGTLTNITRRKTMEEKLQESERRLAEAQRIAQVGSWEWDVPGNRVIWSDELCEMIGVEREAFGSNYEAFIEHVHPAEREKVRALVAQCLIDGRPFDFELRIIRADGEIRFFHCRGRTQMGPSSQAVSMAGTAQDITERKLCEVALAEAQAQLKEYAATLEIRVSDRTAELQSSMKQMEGFCYSIAHDLRAPLRAMEGFAHALMDDYAPRLDESGTEYARRIIAASQRMDHLIQDLLAYGRLSHVDLPRQWLSVEDEVEKVVADCLSHNNDRAAQIELRRPLHSIWANPTALGQILGNLLSNALKFVSPNVPPKIEIWSEEQDDAVRVCVKDNGIGIAPEHHARIFRVFEKLHDPADYHGTGIGLAIASKAVERLNGRLGLESAVGKGSCFWFELPKPPTTPTGKDLRQLAKEIK